MMTLKDDRIIGWIKKGVLSDKEERFCTDVYGREDLTHGQWERLRIINLKVFNGKK